MSGLSKEGGQSSDDSDTAFPSFASAPAPNTENTKKLTRKRKSSEKHHKSKRHDHNHKRHHRQRDPRPKDERSSTTTSVATKSTRAILEELDRESQIAIDTRGDLNLRLFNQSARPGAPKFKRFRNNDRVLGLKDAFIDPKSRCDNPEIRLVYGSKNRIRYVDIDWTDQTDSAERIMPPSAGFEGQITKDEEFIAIEDVSANPTATQNQSKYDDDETSSRPDFRSFEGMAKLDPLDGVTIDKGPTEINSNTGRESSAFTVGELEARIRKDKHDITAWMDLVDRQRTISLSTFTSGNRRQSKRTIVELQLAVYQRGLQENPQSPELVLGYLERCKEVMDSDTLTSEWEKIVESATDPRIFMEYVVFCQGLTARRSVSWMIDVYTKSVKRVLRCGIRQNTRARTRVLIAAMELLHCLCLFLRDAGYIERAGATYQAVLEWYVLASPEALGSTYGHKLGLFEAFWDSGTRRIGNTGAKGWVSFVTCEDKSTKHMEGCDTELLESVFPRMAATADDFYSAERSGMEKCSKAMLTPASVLQLDSPLIDSIDPFSVTIFEDVAPVLIDMEWNERAAGALIDRFLQFVGVVGPRTFVFTHDTLYDRDNLELNSIACTLPYCRSSILSDRLDPSLWTQECSFFPFASLPCGLDSIDMPLPYKKYCLWMWPNSEELQKFARNALELLGLKNSRLSLDMRLQICVVLVEWSFLGSVEEGRSVGKRLLGAYPTSLVLWDCFAKMHARTGNWDEARKVWSKSLAFVANLPETEKAWSIVVRKSWAILEAMHGRGLGVAAKIACAETNAELHALVQDCSHGIAAEALADDVMRAQRLVEQNEHCWNTCPNPEVRNAAAALSLWLAYARSLDVQAVDKVYADFSSSDQSCNERRRMDLCSVQFFHINNSKVHRAQDFRKHVQPAVEMFPYNVVFWDMFLYCESRLRLSNRVCWTLEKIKKCNKQHNPCLQMLFVHVRMRLDRQIGKSSEVSSSNIRKYLKEATCEGASNSPLVWIAAFLYEQKHGTLKKAKKALTAAIRQCPWTKEFFMITLGRKASELGFTEHEKAMMLHGMVACGIRINTAIQ
ncbi:hypothetical protein IW140_003105 [Coemansia sp. RSA 1813]|nr:hypothetical protein EV178_003014 [Coemansia sp. RSA 1646]KAJ1769227.1 hypothetical protein LPJ74_004226 [Coemansia sp. RSA 1843]KAJ2089510.1 hypothetical protein IW138_003399 [Coemansia sp. RSA 986]KAJ2214520.1 hypothetical protein EV179_002925 [Coemansia sp. RSA 487]KAJ2569402.1 hypothetical protein IW140_003105 [Coemansia sp. RSA 1813]